MKKQIDIGIATVCRKEGFGFLVKSLQALKGDSFEINKLYVVCNTHDKTYVEYVRLELSKQKYAYEVIVETKRGISYARNHVLKRASSDYLAFLDDDEWVDENWLENLIITIDVYSADVVFGPVISITEGRVSIWARAQARTRHRTGTLVAHGGTGNVLMKTSAFRTLGIGFNEDFALSGGEDTEFFMRLMRMEKTLTWCDEAWAYERAEYGRNSFVWAVRRAYRGGQTYKRISRLHQPNSHKIFSSAIILFIKAAVKLSTLSIFFLIGLWERAARDLLSIVSYIGQLTMIFGGNHFFREYKE